jgi:hypothetical protein
MTTHPIPSVQAVQEGLGRCEAAVLEPLLSAQMQMTAMTGTGGIASVGVSQELGVGEDSAA